MNDGEADELKKLVDELRATVASKDEQIASLQENAKNQEQESGYELVVEDKKTLRSVSFVATDY